MFEKVLLTEATPDRFAKTLSRLRNQAYGLLELGYGVAALISLVGMAYWCPRCGQWMGAGSEGEGPNVPKPKAPPPPDRLLKAISTPIASQPAPPAKGQSPSIIQNELKPNQRIGGSSIACHRGKTITANPQKNSTVLPRLLTDENAIHTGAAIPNPTLETLEIRLI